MSPPLRVALLVAGQMRSVEDAAVRASLQRFLNDSFGSEASVDIFVSTWSKHGISHNHGNGVPRSFEDDTVTASAVQRWFSPYGTVCDVTIHDLAAWEMGLSPAYHRVYTEGFHWCDMYIKGTMVPQLFTLWDANRLRTAHETATGKRYDVVLRIRPDVVFNSGLRPDEWTAEALCGISAINCEDAWYPQRIYDVFFYGSGRSMTYLCDAYNHLDALLAHPFDNGLHPRDACRILYVQAALIHGLPVHDLDRVICDIVR